MWIAIFTLSGLFYIPTAHSQEPRKIRVGIPTLSPIIAATLVPRDRGYFKQEGLDVETIVIRSAPSVLALAAKEIDFLMTGGGGLSGALRGLPLRVVFAPLRRPTYALYAKPEIRTIAELEGKRVGISSYGSGPDLLLRDVLKKRMSDGGKKVTILAVGSGTERYIAQVKGLLYMRANRDGAAGALARALKSKESETGPAFDEIRPTMTEDGTITLDEQRKALEYLLSPAQQKEPPRLERIYDFTLARKAYQELQARGWKPE